jgi:predicted helicase
VSLQLVRQYQTNLETLLQYGGSRNETSLRSAFQELLSQWARSQDLALVPELEYKTGKNRIVPDGTLKDALRQSLGYWEAKDETDSLDNEIQKKFAKGYPKDNILFEDTQTAVLIQHGEEVGRATMSDVAALHKLLETFFAFEPAQVKEFRSAIERFRADLPDLLEVLRSALAKANSQKEFKTKREAFVLLCQTAMNPSFSEKDAGEMLIQHILTGEIFKSVFDNAQYFEENNIAQQLEGLSKTVYVGQVRREIDSKTRTYYGAIKAAAAQIADHHEKQKFLKVLYETFYRAYNPAGADRLGIFYTPNEIVEFMIHATDALLERHFQKSLADHGVEILDPATGTGTFITQLIEHLPKGKLEQKYSHELHCNELALLPYYIANLNIEATYAQKMGSYKEFQNIVLVDTLDNTGFGIRDIEDNLFFSLTEENLERIKRQNERPIHVIIGNPPYRANQQNENDNNKNRAYQVIDKRIKETYIAASSAQKTKMYDMYSRFIRWATDRLQNNGLIAFVMNRSFIDSKTFDGFRKVAAQEFGHIYIVDLGGDVRANPKLSGPKHNVFAIQTGVAIAFLLRQPKQTATQIFYARRPEMATALEKLDWLQQTKFEQLEFERIRPDEKHNWLNQPEHDWDSFIPVASKETKATDVESLETSIFKLYSLGVVTNRDEWVYDFEIAKLEREVKFLIDVYNKDVARVKKGEITDVGADVNYQIKWTRAVKNDLKALRKYNFDASKIRPCLYRPFVLMNLYFDARLNEMRYQNPLIFPNSDSENRLIAFDVTDKPFSALASKYLVDLHFNGDSQCLPLYRYENGNRLENITDFGLAAFRGHYRQEGIGREDVFAYVYAVLHHTAYRQKYALNLRQEFPRIPFYENFQQWVAWGQALLKLHLDFETAQPFDLQVLETTPTTDTPEGLARLQKAKLKADKLRGEIVLDGLTTLAGVPPEAWDYKLGNRSALEWVLERHRETTPKDPTIRERFHTYRFADYKPQVIELLQRVCTVSLETVKIVQQMPAETL